MATSRVNQTGAVGFENGVNHGGFGDFDSRNELSSEAGRPYTAMPLQKEFDTITDESITSAPYKQEEQLGRINCDNNYEYVNRFTGRNSDYLWAWGFETVHPVSVYRVGDLEITPAKDDEFTDDAANTLNFLREENYKDIMGNNIRLFIFDNVADATISESSSSETLTATAGDDITTSHTFGNMYEHQYELPRDRKQRDFSSKEAAKLSDLDLSGRTRQLYQTFAKSYHDYYLVSPNVMAENFSLSSSAGEYVNISHTTAGHNVRIIGSDNARKDNGESITPVDFSMPCNLKQTTDNVVHSQMTAEMFAHVEGENFEDATKVDMEVTELDTEVSFSLDRLQSSASGYYIMEPNLEGHYDVTSSVTIGRQSGTQFQEWRDLRQHLGARYAWNKGGLMQELIVKSFSLDQAGADDSPVAQEPVELNIHAVCDTHKFTDWLYDEVYADSPVVFRVRDNNPANGFAPKA